MSTLPIPASVPITKPAPHADRDRSEQPVSIHDLLPKRHDPTCDLWEHEGPCQPTLPTSANIEGQPPAADDTTTQASMERFTDAVARVTPCSCSAQRARADAAEAKVRGLTRGHAEKFRAWKDEIDEYDQLLTRQADLLTRTANAIKGDPGPLRTWSHANLPERAAFLKAQLDAALAVLEHVGCQFHACEGPDVEPVDAVTCRVCWTIRDLRAAIAVDPGHLKGFAMWLDREEWGVIIDALIQHRGHAEARKAVNSESTSDVRADMCADLIARLNAAAILDAPKGGSESVCSTCGDTGRVPWEPFAHHDDEPDQPCPDCVATRPRNNGIVLTAEGSDRG